ncbi:uncharacterized protein LOC111253903 isoform X2 [Varroa destructor]|uniref:FERM and PDZ domain-containing protein 4 n=1 Tax=Varroa destructor TaxID=109461 RepID=A0A7M7L401_VARDE|nr:uncharacterized protein LOC111253903 isoform X2 [Varroa destructor]
MASGLSEGQFSPRPSRFKTMDPVMVHDRSGSVAVVAPVAVISSNPAPLSGSLQKEKALESGWDAHTDVESTGPRDITADQTEETTVIRQDDLGGRVVLQDVNGSTGGIAEGAMRDQDTSSLSSTQTNRTASQHEEQLVNIQSLLRRACTAHITSNQRIYYMNHETRTTSWVPPVEAWRDPSLPYGWERAVDAKGVDYYINHVNKTTTYHNPLKDYVHEDPPPSPREVILERHHELGFGFVAGSERPVIVRFVTEGGPSEDRLLPGDEIIAINGVDVKTAPREHVIDMVKSCQSTIKLIVCQPVTNNTTKKSALLTAAKKAKLRSRPSKVRFAEGVVINGSPLYGSELEGAPVANVIKVFLENGHTKSFKYDSATDVQSVLDVLKEKVRISDGAMDLFGIVVEQLKSVGGRRNKISLLDPRETLGKIAALPGSHNLRCLFRVALLPSDPYELLQNCPHSFEYLYQQCCNDLVHDKITPPLEPEVALRLSSLHLHQHLLSQGLQAKPTSIKQIEGECGLTRFVSYSLLESMKTKQLRKILAQSMKQNESLCSPGQKQLTPLQVKLHFLNIMSKQEGYGCRILEPVAECEGSSFHHGEYLLLSGRSGLRKFHRPPSHHLMPHGQSSSSAHAAGSGHNHHPSAINIDKVHPPSKGSDGVSVVAVEERSDGTVTLATSSGASSNGHSLNHPQISELVKIENISKISISKEDDFTYIINITPTNIVIGMEERAMLELVLLLRGYYQLLRKEELFVEWRTINPWETLLSEFRSISRSSSTTGSQRNLDFNMNLANRFELSVESHSIPSIAKPVETINHRVVARQLERAYTSPGQIGGLRDSPVQFTLGGDDDILMGVSSSATPDLLGHVMHPAIMMNNRQPDIDVGSINESTSSGEANEEKPPHLKAADSLLLLAAAVEKTGSGGPHGSAHITTGVLGPSELRMSRGVEATEIKGGSGSSASQEDSDDSSDTGQSQQLVRQPNQIRSVGASLRTDALHHVLSRDRPDRNSFSSNSSGNSTSNMQSFTGPFDGPPVRTSFANYTDTLRKYEAMAYREQSGSGGTLDGGQLQLSGLPGTHSVTRIELPAEASLGFTSMCDIGGDVIDLTLLPPPSSPELAELENLGLNQYDLGRLIIPPPPPPIEFCTQNEIIARFEQASRDIYDIIQTPPPKAPPRQKRGSPEPVKPIRLSQHLPAPPPDLDTLTRTTTADSPTSSSRPNTSPLSNASSTGNPPTAPPTPRKVPEQTNGFSRAQHQISTMASRLKKVHTMKNQSSVSKRDPIKLSQAHDALISEARQFVTSSKLLVREMALRAQKNLDIGGMQLEKLHDHLITCVALLERMFLYSETVLMQSAEVSHPLADHMDRVAMEFHRMIGKHNLTGDSGLSEEELGTQLAKNLNSLMRILRT